MKEAIVFVIYNSITKQVVTELRPSNDYYAPNEYIFPGGRVDSTDNSVQTTFFREFEEEIGVQSKDVAYLDTITVNIAEQPWCLTAFAVLQWQGMIPQNIKDKGNPIVWKPLIEMIQNPRQEVSQIAHALLSFVRDSDRDHL